LEERRWRFKGVGRQDDRGTGKRRAGGRIRRERKRLTMVKPTFAPFEREV